MLHAEIHGKLSPEAPELERAEDVLTSTVFGTLLIGRGAPVLVDWLKRATNLGDQSLHLKSEELSWWFWPRLAEAEPDIVLRFAETLVVVEAKFLSAKSGTEDVSADETQDQRNDQLARQWRSVQEDVDSPHAPADLRKALEQVERRRIVYLVRGRDVRRASEELRESIGRIQSASASDDMFLLTWDDLHAVLTSRIRSGKVKAARWERDLRALLERRGLRGFIGFPLVLNRIDGDGRASAFFRRRRLRKPRWKPRFRGALRNCSQVVIPKRLASVASDTCNPGQT